MTCSLEKAPTCAEAELAASHSEVTISVNARHNFGSVFIVVLEDDLSLIDEKLFTGLRIGPDNPFGERNEFTVFSGRRLVLA
jgi:hypothetical protein